ncbi:MAG: maleylacetoacetate isomerase [bacterium]|nr:maleylacetoacetate isomerase [bacterium]
MKLYTYFRSSAAYRVRIALALKGLPWEPAYVHMLRGGGEQHSPAYRGINPQGLVPTFADEGFDLVQSIAICEYLEEKYPEPRLLPGDLRARAYVRAVMSAVACDIHPLNNLRVLKYVTSTLGHNEAEKLAWYRHWIADGFAGLEGLIVQAGRSGVFACGDQPTLADAFIVPQVYNARRFDCPMDACPNITRIADACLALPQFQAARPEAQGDAGA